MSITWFDKYKGEAYQVELNLQTPRQLFNTLDPAPFHEKDLDREAERYIIDSVDELALHRPVHLLIHLPEHIIVADMANQFQCAIQRYFNYRASEARHHLRRCFREGRITLFVGFSFLLCCLLLRQILLPYGDDILFRLLAEGVLIMGWVALWHPIDVFLYHWWPLLRRYKLLKKISGLSVEIKPALPYSFYPDNHSLNI